MQEHAPPSRTRLAAPHSTRCFRCAALFVRRATRAVLVEFDDLPNIARRSALTSSRHHVFRQDREQPVVAAWRLGVVPVRRTILAQVERVVNLVYAIVDRGGVKRYIITAPALPAEF